MEWKGLPDLFLIFLPFLPPHPLPPIHFYLSSAFFFHPLSSLYALCWITHAYLTSLHLQKQQTYSLAFRVLMKAPRVVANSLLPCASSQLNPCNPTSPLLITQSAAPLPPKPGQIISCSALFSSQCNNWNCKVKITWFKQRIVQER